MELSDAQIQTWIQMMVWPMVRISGLMMAAPLFGDGVASARLRLMLALSMTVLIAPLLPQPAPLTSFSAEWWLRIAAELTLGVIMGFVLKIVFEAVVLGGEYVGNGMGIGFAQLADPLHGAAAPVIGQFLQIVAILLFLAFGGHLRLLQALADSFHTMPVANVAVSTRTAYALAELGSELFSGAIAVALPTVAALLLVNIAFGVMSRSAPTLNALSVGFPLSIVCGLVLLRVNLPQLSSVFSGQLDRAFAVLSSLINLP
jgi:flagellar biosynthetic protein FliR